MRKVLVTGGAGFIGSHLVSFWESRGAEVVTIDDLRVEPLTAVRGEFRQKSVLGMDAGDLDGVDVVYHLASHKSVPESFSRPLEYLDNVASVSHLLELAAAAGTPKVVIASTCEVYGEAAALPSAEGDPLSPRSPYAATKVALEMISRAYQEAAGLGTDVTVVRFFNVYGPHERADALVPRLCKSVLEGQPLPLEGSARQRRDLTYISDLIPRLARVATVSSVPTLNLGSGVTHSVADVADAVSRLHSGAAVRRLPERKNEIQEFRADVTLERRLLGPLTAPVSLDEGVELTYAWWKSRLMTETFMQDLDKEFAR
ncbi:NAD-dependent epimerase/dehydratase family protein [Streptomyces sp. NPDC059104]|uniref:NAD-dependent epimerase/dehydratase family protein n=1 Tax=Streptomyces sp. NPDC059104 TaxID=3346729 RepID=UPI00367ADCDA